MGFDLAQVLSDDKHYSPFICGLCKHLVSIDAVVTKCSHAFCRRCLETHVTSYSGKSTGRNSVCSCPTCSADISASKSPPSARLGFTKAAAESLEQAQPLAYQVLSQIQVACIDQNQTIQCEWTGDYGSFVQHCSAMHGQNGANEALQACNKSQSSIPHIIGKRRGGRPSLRGHKSMSMPSLISEDTDENDGDDNRSLPDAPHQDEEMKRTLSLEDMLKHDRGSPIISGDLLERGYKSPRQVNDSIAQNPENDKQNLDDALKDEPPHMVQRTVSGDSLARTVDLTFGNKSKNFEQPQRRAGKRKSNPDRDNDLDVSYSQATDWNMSINSFNGWNNSYVEPTATMDKVVEEDDDETEYALEFEPENEVALSAEDQRKIRERAEKLKKQANAKFNKGDFGSARSLYSEGISVMAPIKTPNDDERELLSNVHSNRAVTFFREKKFEDCIADCDKAIGFDSSYDKSWIRKWRALMALGNFDGAYACLEAAAATIPESKRINEELTKCRIDKELITHARAMIDQGEFQKARDVLKPYSRSSDNIGLLFVAARADACLGMTESALEKVNKALRFNPTHVLGLELRGFTLYLAGETEKGAHLLQEAYDRNRDNKSVRAELMRCQKTHSAATKARSAVKRGRYQEAVDHFCASIKESASVPFKAPLYGILRTERAEAYLLCKKYQEALRDCEAVLTAQPENAPAWSVRADIMISTGAAQEAKVELKRIRHTWGADNPTIEEAYKRVDFELRVLKVDDELSSFMDDLKSGKVDKIFPEGKRKSNRRGKSDDNGDGKATKSKSRGQSKSRARSRGRIDKSPEKGRRSSNGKSRGKSRGPGTSSSRRRSKSAKRSSKESAPLP